MQVVFTDGLGNEMFQYALYLALHHKKPNLKINTGIISRGIIHNGFELCDDFEIERNNLKIVDGGWFGGGLTIFAIRYLKNLCCYLEDVNVFSSAVFSTRKPIINGYWQNEQYFSCISDEVRRAFTFRNVDEFNLSIGKEMASCQSVSLHIRRGDYLKDPQYHVCTEQYYIQAISYMKGHVNNPLFYVFSDDLEWSEQFMERQGVVYKMMRHNRRKDSYKDMFLMTQCCHNILANSSFSWWGAWLGRQEDRIVVSPSVWNRRNKGIHPQLDRWIKINV